MFNSGYVKSITFDIPSFEPKNTSTIPVEVDLHKQLKSAVDQGTRGICVSVCVTDMLRYLYAGTDKKYKKREDFFYNHRSNKSIDGMSPRNAFEIAQANGLVMSYATLKSVEAIRVAILSNGPVLIALPVYGDDFEFWKKKFDDQKPTGHHAVTLVGYNDEAKRFMLRNSWGVTWGLNGYSYFPYTEYRLILEAWTAFK